MSRACIVVCASVNFLRLRSNAPVSSHQGKSSFLFRRANAVEYFQRNAELLRVSLLTTKSYAYYAHRHSNHGVSACLCKCVLLAIFFSSLRFFQLSLSGKFVMFTMTTAFVACETRLLDAVSLPSHISHERKHACLIGPLMVSCVCACRRLSPASSYFECSTLTRFLKIFITSP